MSNAKFASAFARVNRAEKQIEELDAKANAFFETKPYEFFPELNPEGTEEAWKVRLNKPIPEDIFLKTGEILLNLRSPLDHIVCELATSHCGSSDRVCFPFGKTPQTFEKVVKEKIAGRLPPEAIELIREAKPYIGGDELLVAVHDLCNCDKHVAFVPIRKQPTTAGSFGRIAVITGSILVLGSRHGQHLLRHDGGFYAPNISAEPTYNEELHRIEFNFVGPPNTEDMEFLVCTPGSRFQADYKPELNLAFDKIPVVACQPIIEALGQMRQLVLDICSKFRDRFA